MLKSSLRVLTVLFVFCSLTLPTFAQYSNPDLDQQQQNDEIRCSMLKSLGGNCTDKDIYRTKTIPTGGSKYPGVFEPQCKKYEMATPIYNNPDLIGKT